MARGGRHGRKNKKGGRKMGQYKTQPQDRAASYHSVERTNELLKETYRGLGLLDDEEFEEMFKAMQTDLPNSFRFTSSKAAALESRKILKDRYIPKIIAEKYNDEFVPPPKPIPWYPNDLAWDIKVPKSVIRKHPPFKAFQNFLVTETEVGTISRQEVVSMIPPLFLDVHPGMVVLDMCASPGSKSAQLAEMIHGDEENRVQNFIDGTATAIELLGGDYDDSGRSTGLLIANDADYKRAYMLTHQVKRLNLAGIIITNNDASIFPSIEVPLPNGGKGQLKYDRILADVPCSGDGTVRKNLSIWQKWTPKDGIGLHNLQRRILVRGLELLKVGGRLVYSTCSMNPIENEAVVASAIKDCGGMANISIADCSDDFPALIRKPGLTSWKVFDRNQPTRDARPQPVFFATYQDYLDYVKEQEASGSTQKISNVEPSMFPPDSTYGIPLERCIRIYAHLQDTGGFFVTVLEKKRPFKKSSTQGTPSGVVKNEISNGKSPDKDSQSKKRGPDKDIDSPGKKLKTADGAAKQPEVASNAADDVVKQPEEVIKVADPVPLAAANEGDGGKQNGGAPEETVPTPAKPAEDGKPVGPTNDEKEATPPKANEYKKKKSEPKGEVFKFLSETDPAIDEIFRFYGVDVRFPRDRFLVRNEDGKTAKAIYYASDLAKHILTTMEGTSLKFIHGGIKMFVKHDTKHFQGCNWRIQTEGINIIAPWCAKRTLTCNDPKIFFHLLIEMFPIFNDKSKRQLGKLYPQLFDLSPGCCLLNLVPDDCVMNGFESPMVLPIWRNPGSLNLMCSKDDRAALLLRLYGLDNPQIKDHTKKRDILPAEETDIPAFGVQGSDGEDDDMDMDLPLGDAAAAKAEAEADKEEEKMRRERKERVKAAGFYKLYDRIEGHRQRLDAMDAKADETDDAE